MLLYFTKEAKEDSWDEINNRVICATDAFLEEDFENEIGLSNAKSFIDERKKAVNEE